MARRCLLLMVSTPGLPKARVRAPLAGETTSARSAGSGLSRRRRCPAASNSAVADDWPNAQAALVDDQYQTNGSRLPSFHFVIGRVLLDGVGVLTRPEADRQRRGVLVRGRRQAIQPVAGKGAEAIEFRFEMTEEVVRQVVPKQGRCVAIGTIKVDAARIRYLGDGGRFRSHDHLLHTVCDGHYRHFDRYSPISRLN